MKTTRSLRACRVQANVWPRDCWQKSGMIARVTRMPAACKPWGEPRQCCIKAACTPSGLAAPARTDHRQQAPKILHFFGLQLGMPRKDHASSRLSRKAKRLDNCERRGTLAHAQLKTFLHLSCF